MPRSIYISEYRIDSNKNEFVRKRERNLLNNMVFSDMISGLKNYTYDDPLLTYPIVKGDGRPSLLGNYVVADTFFDYFISSQKFEQVAEIVQHINRVLEADQDTFLVNMDACMIKMNLHSPEDSVHRIWELQRYQIVR